MLDLRTVLFSSGQVSYLCLHSVRRHPVTIPTIGQTATVRVISRVLTQYRDMCLRLPKLGGNPLARSTSEENKKNAEIERILRKDKKDQAKKVKILLLGQ